MSDSDIEMAELDNDNIDMTDIKGILSGSEEGEISDSDFETMKDDVVSKDNTSPSMPVQHLFQTEGNNGINRSVFDDIDLAEMGDRANRFGLDLTSDTNTLEKEKSDLYSSLSIESQEDKRHARLDTIHVYGTNKMKTNNVFEYFFAHKPLFLEWVNENCCNVVWKDDISAARAMVFYSKEIIYDSADRTISMNGKDISSVKSGDVVKAADIKVIIPPGKWRVGAPHPLAQYIFLRFANKNDKMVSGKEKLKVFSKKYKDTENIHTGLISESMKFKIKSARNYEVEEERAKNPWGELCETWGINDSQEVFGIPLPAVGYHNPVPTAKHPRVKDRIGSSHSHIPVTERLSLPLERHRNNVKTRLGKRPPEVIAISDSSQSEEDSRSSDEEWTSKRKVPRMRMHADDEEEKMNKRKPSDQSSQWDDEVGINNITVQVKNELIEKPVIQIIKETETRKDLRSRIGRRRNSYDSDSDHSESPRSSSKQSTATVWSRLDTSRCNDLGDSQSESDSDQDLRRTLTKSSVKSASSRPGFNSDLRSRIGKKSDFRASPLRIEVDNEHYSRSYRE